MRAVKAKRLRKWWGVKHVRHCNPLYGRPDADIPSGLGQKTMTRSVSPKPRLNRELP